MKQFNESSQPKTAQKKLYLVSIIDRLYNLNLIFSGIMQMKFNEKGLLQRGKITLSRKRGIINRIVKRIERAQKIAALTQKRAEINQKRAERKRARQSRG